MNLDQRNDDNKAYGQFKSSLDIAMGILYITISGYAIQFKFITDEYGKPAVYSIASLFILYGIFRIYRGLIYYKHKTRKF